MADFFTGLAKRTMGIESIVKPLIASPFTPGAMVMSEYALDVASESQASDTTIPSNRLEETGEAKPLARQPDFPRVASTLPGEQWVWSQPVGNGEDKGDKGDNGDKEDKEDSSFQPTTDDHTREQFPLLAVEPISLEQDFPVHTELHSKLVNPLDGETGRQGNGGKESVGRLTATSSQNPVELPSGEQSRASPGIAHLPLAIESSQVSSEALPPIQRTSANVQPRELQMESLDIVQRSESVPCSESKSSVSQKDFNLSPLNKPNYSERSLPDLNWSSVEAGTIQQQSSEPLLQPEASERSLPSPDSSTSLDSSAGEFATPLPQSSEPLPLPIARQAHEQVNQQVSESSETLLHLPLVRSPSPSPISASLPGLSAHPPSPVKPNLESSFPTSQPAGEERSQPQPLSDFPASLAQSEPEPSKFIQPLTPLSIQQLPQAGIVQRQTEARSASLRPLSEPQARAGLPISLEQPAAGHLAGDLNELSFERTDAVAAVSVETDTAQPVNSTFSTLPFAKQETGQSMQPAPEVMANRLEPLHGEFSAHQPTEAETIQHHVQGATDAPQPLTKVAVEPSVSHQPEISEAPTLPLVRSPVSPAMNSFLQERPDSGQTASIPPELNYLEQQPERVELKGNEDKGILSAPGARAIPIEPQRNLITNQESPVAGTNQPQIESIIASTQPISQPTFDFPVSNQQKLSAPPIYQNESQVNAQTADSQKLGVLNAPTLPLVRSQAAQPVVPSQQQGFGASEEPMQYGSVQEGYPSRQAGGAREAKTGLSEPYREAMEFPAGVGSSAVSLSLLSLIRPHTADATAPIEQAVLTTSGATPNPTGVVPALPAFMTVQARGNHSTETLATARSIASRQYLTANRETSAVMGGVEPRMESVSATQGTGQSLHNVFAPDRVSSMKGSQSERTPMIQVTIGRVSVRRANPPPAPAPSRRAVFQKPALSLSDYLQQRERGLL
jgi:hypothetical protein